VGGHVPPRRPLLDAPRRLGVDEPEAQLPDVPRVREALRVLIDDGLATPSMGAIAWQGEGVEAGLVRPPAVM
jgi:hypothetical protein